MSNDWQAKYEAYIARWPTIAKEYRALPPALKADCGAAMKWWTELGLIKEKNT